MSEAPSDLLSWVPPTGFSLLIIEDDAQLCRIIKLHLSPSPIQVFLAESQDEAMSALQTQCFDLILMDLTGFLESMKAIKEQCPRTSVVITSGDHGAARDVLHMGAVAFLAKPFTRTQLIDALMEAYKKRTLDLLPKDIEVLKVETAAHLERVNQAIQDSVDRSIINRDNLERTT